MFIAFPRYRGDGQRLGESYKKMKILQGEVCHGIAPSERFK